MRLIDADTVISVAEGEFSEEDVSKIRWLISHIGTAYELNKVVEELEKLRDKAHECFCIGHDTEDMAEYNAFDTAIEIVKEGGKEC